MDDLKGHAPAWRELLSLVYPPHSPGPDEAHDFIIIESASRAQRILPQRLAWKKVSRYFDPATQQLLYVPTQLQIVTTLTVQQGFLFRRGKVSHPIEKLPNVVGVRLRQRENPRSEDLWVQAGGWKEIDRPFVRFK